MILVLPDTLVQEWLSLLLAHGAGARDLGRPADTAEDGGNEGRGADDAASIVKGCLAEAEEALDWLGGAEASGISRGHLEAVRDSL